MLTSVSKGVFVLKGKKPFAKKNSLPNPTHYMDNEEMMHARMQIHHTLLQQVQENIDIIQYEINSKLFSDVIQYITTSHENFKKKCNIKQHCNVNSSHTMENNSNNAPGLIDNITSNNNNSLSDLFCHTKTGSEIPVAALVLGINKQDHDLIFHDLITQLLHHSTNHVVSLKSVKCASVKAIISTIISQLTQQLNMDGSDDDDEDDLVVSRSANKKRGRSMATMRMVLQWYQSLQESQLSPSKSLSAFNKLSIISPEKQMKKESLTNHMVSSDVESMEEDCLTQADPLCVKMDVESVVKSPRKILSPRKSPRKMTPSSIHSSICHSSLQHAIIDLTSPPSVVRSPLKSTSTNPSLSATPVVLLNNLNSPKKSVSPSKLCSPKKSGMSQKATTCYTPTIKSNNENVVETVPTVMSPSQYTTLKSPIHARRTTRLSVGSIKKKNYVYSRGEMAGGVEGGDEDDEDNSLEDEDFKVDRDLEKNGDDVKMINEYEEENDDLCSYDSDDEKQEVDEDNDEGITFTNKIAISLNDSKVDRGEMVKRKRGSGAGDPIVLVLEDFEGFNAVVLQDLISILSNYQDKLPVVLLMGVSTTPACIHHSLPRSTTSLLSIRTFHSLPSSQHLSVLVDKLVLNPCTIFRLGSKEFNFLLDCFLFNDFSILNFVKSFKLSMLNHFLSCPATTLLYCLLQQQHSNTQQSSTKQPSPSQQQKQQQHVEIFLQQHLDVARSIASFRRFVECSRPEEQIKLLQDDQYAKSTVLNLMSRLVSYHQKFFISFHCLHVLTNQLPSYPLGKLPRELYGLCVHENICLTPAYNKALNIIRTFSRTEMLSVLERILSRLNTVASNINSDGNNNVNNLDEHHDNNINDHYKEFQNNNHEGDGDDGGCQDKSNDKNTSVFVRKLKEELQTHIHNLNNLDAEKEEEEGKEEGRLRLKRRMSMNALKQALEESKRRSYGGDSGMMGKYAVVRNGVVDALDSLFRDNLQHYKTLPLHELIYSDNLHLLKPIVLPAPRVSLHRALNNPAFYIEDMDQSDSNGITRDQPDICIAYKLHMECGRLINLYDWMQAFSSIVNGDVEENEDGSIDKLTQARFIRAVSELQFMGFIKATKKKIDHVARLTWALC